MKLTEQILASIIGLLVVGTLLSLFSVSYYLYQKELVRANDLEQQVAYYAARFKLCKSITDQKQIILKWGAYGE